MAQFDVHRFGRGLVIDCQSDLLSHIETRFVIPLVPRAMAQVAARRLNPHVVIEGEELIMVTQAASAVLARDFGDTILSLADRSFEITDALDVLISGV